MKRLILIICLILSCILFINECIHISDEKPTDNIYASKKKIAYLENYIPIPKELSKQYKAEIEQIIDEEYPKVIKKIDECTNHAKRLHDSILSNGFNIDDYTSLALIPATNIPTADMDLYAKLLKITQEKYLGIKYTPIPTDDTGVLSDILSPYFIDNNVNKKKLIKIVTYGKEKIIVVEKYIQEVTAKMTDEEYILTSVYPPTMQATYQNVLGTKYTCYHSDCYNLNSFYYDKQTKTYYIDSLIDLMNWNEHEEHKAPTGEGFVTHLIFRAKVKDDKVSGKCIGYITGVVVPEYDGNGKFSSFHYRFFGKYKGIPSTIKDIKPFEKSFSIDEIIFNRKIKILADI